jgi:hypothetical protein
MQEIKLAGLDLYQATVQKTRAAAEKGKTKSRSSRSAAAPAAKQPSGELAASQWRRVASSPVASAAAPSPPQLSYNFGAHQPQQRAMYSAPLPPTPAWLLQHQTPQHQHQNSSLYQHHSNLSRNLSHNSTSTMPQGLSRQSSLGLSVQDFLALAPPPLPLPNGAARQTSLGLQDFLAIAPPAPAKREPSLVLDDFLSMLPPPSRQTSLVVEDFLANMMQPPLSRQTSLVLEDFLARGTATATSAPPPPAAWPLSRASSLGVHDLTEATTRAVGAVPPPPPPAAGTYAVSQSLETPVPKEVFVSQQFSHPKPAALSAVLSPPTIYNESQSSVVPRAVFVPQPQFANHHPTAQECPTGAPPALHRAVQSFSLSDQLDQVRKRRMELMQQQQGQDQDQDDQAESPLAKKARPGSAASSTDTASTITADSFADVGGGLRHSPRAPPRSAARVVSTTGAANQAGVVQQKPPTLYSMSTLSVVTPEGATGAAASAPLRTVSACCPLTNDNDAMIRQQQQQQQQQHALDAHGSKLRQQVLFHLRLEEAAASKEASSWTNTHDDNAAPDKATRQHQLQLLSARTKNLQQQLADHQRLEAEL